MIGEGDSRKGRQPKSAGSLYKSIDNIHQKESRPETGAVLIVSGLSGAGKSTLVTGLIKEHGEGFVVSISSTTRSKRVGESSNAYDFITTEQFKMRQQGGEFIETVEFGGNFYGTPKQPILDAVNRGMNVVCDVEANGAKEIKSFLDKEGIFYKTVFIMPPSYSESKTRLMKRGDTDGSVNKRLKSYPDQLSAVKSYDYVIVNNDLSDACKQLIDVYNATIALGQVRDRDRIPTEQQDSVIQSTRRIPRGNSPQVKKLVKDIMEQMEPDKVVHNEVRSVYSKESPIAHHRRALLL